MNILSSIFWPSVFTGKRSPSAFYSNFHPFFPPRLHSRTFESYSAVADQESRQHEHWVQEPGYTFLYRVCPVRKSDMHVPSTVADYHVSSVALTHTQIRLPINDCV